MSKNEGVSKKAKNMMYAQQIAHLPAGDFDKLVDEIKYKLQPKKFAAIVHDKDVDDHGKPEAAHVHAMMSFENARSVNSVAKILNDKSQYIEVWEGNSGNGYAYLIHATDTAQNKYQYKPTEVRANFDYLAELQKIKQNIKKAKGDAETKILLDALYDGMISKSDIEKKLSGSQYGKLKKQIDNIWSKVLQNRADIWRKDMIENNKAITVIWIYGFAGTGKSSLAKEYARKKNRDYFISGSSRDIFQNYEGQHTIILDELRPAFIQYADLLRITDPYGADAQVMAPSRYSDKALAADLIIITSPFNPAEFYERQFEENYTMCSQIDSLEQLLRRISLTIQMTDNFIYLSEYCRDLKKFIVKKDTQKTNTYARKARQDSLGNSLDIYNALFDGQTQEGCGTNETGN